MPKSAFYAPRSRYRADKLLVWLSKSTPTDIVLGVTEQDISTTLGKHEDWGIFGLGYCPGKASVISSFRLKKKGKVGVEERLCRVAIHEVGHNFGLPHCPNACIMADAQGSIKSVDSEANFCKQCRDKIDHSN
jgi:archaemetzincin